MNYAHVVWAWVRQSAIVVILLCVSLSGHAQVYDLSTENTSLQVDVGSAGAGLSGWDFDGVNQLIQEGFYYSVGPSGDVYSITNLTASGPTLGGQTLFGTIIKTNLSETYSDSDLSVKTTYTLQGGSGSATLGTAVTLQNLSNASQTFHFYQYSYFDVGNVSGGQNVQFTTTNSPYNVIQTGTGGAMTGMLTALPGTVEEDAAIYDNNPYGSQFGLINGDTAPLFNDSNTNAGVGNVNFVYEFDVTLAADGSPGSSLSISETQAVPEPSPWALILSGAAVISLLSKRPLIVKKS